MINLSIPDFKCVPNTLPPDGGPVSLSCKVDSNLKFLRVKFWIADDEQFAFKTASGTKREVFVPSATGKISKPSSSHNISPAGKTTIVATGDTSTHHQPLKVHVLVQGFFRQNQSDPAKTQGRVVTVTIDTLRQQAQDGRLAEDGALTMALRLVNKDVRVSKKRIAEILTSGVGKGIKVSEFMVGKVLDGGSSADLLKTLRGK